MSEDRLQQSSVTTPLPSRKALPPFEALRAFDAIARLGGVRRAAEYLCRDHGVISRHLRTIEEWTGTRLIDRTPGGAVLTADGLRYHKIVAGAMDAIANGTVDLMRRGDNHRLRIRCMPGFALNWLSARLGDFERSHPGLDLEIRPTDRSPDLLSNHADVDIRFVAEYGVQLEIPPECRSVEFASSPIVAVATRDYLARFPQIREPRDLLKHQLMHEDNFDRWRNWLASHHVYDDAELTGPRLWQGHLTLDGARHGRGVALTNYLLAADDLKNRSLVEIGSELPSFMPRALGIWHLITKLDRTDASPVRHFREWLLSVVRKEHPQLVPPT
ncbi:LysR substrate-binding domain-containing protein [Steroidobacter sp.]|uniref:LysR substrate-binding domain-containing protein n=1 Tax=Steroidobacter sp. TaxID=1978227 RepID=UPI001A3F3D04|nr:LysR substrate-binding domain-containing protein [Steroidobacter sp.]MBL8269203.1 LysR family transcriptional regulator [Steroidobacter sp.]